MFVVVVVVFNLIFALFLFLFIYHYLKKTVHMDPVHDRVSMDPVHDSGPWTRSKMGVHGPLVHVLSSPSDSYQFEISGRLKLVSVPFSSLVLYIGQLEKSFPEGIMKSSEMGKVITLRRVRIVQYPIIFSFHLAKRINHPDPGRDRKVRYCSLF